MHLNTHDSSSESKCQSRRKLQNSLLRMSSIFLTLAFALLSAIGSANASDSPGYPRAEDVSTLDGLMRAYYDVVSGPPDTARDVARDQSLHHPQAQLMVPTQDERGQLEVRRMSVQEFHAWSKPHYDEGFYEHEIRREVRQYGKMLHVFSHYDAQRTHGGPSIGRGINSIQIYFDGKRYWILSETWQSESPDKPLPRLVPNVH